MRVLCGMLYKKRSSSPTTNDFCLSESHLDKWSIGVLHFRMYLSERLKSLSELGLQLSCCYSPSEDCGFAEAMNPGPKVFSLLWNRHAPPENNRDFFATCIIQLQSTKALPFSCWKRTLLAYQKGYVQLLMPNCTDIFHVKINCW